jgi:hypothetical protein
MAFRQVALAALRAAQPARQVARSALPLARWTPQTLRPAMPLAARSFGAQVGALLYAP